MSFTAEEAWAMFAGPESDMHSDETNFTQACYALPGGANAASPLDRFSALRDIRAELMKQRAEVRIAGGIGCSLQAKAEMKASAEKVALLGGFGDDLKFVFLNSQAQATIVRK